MSTPIFTWPIRVYYEDTDASGVAYHARYLHWFERTRSEWLRSKARSHQRLLAECGAVFTLASVDIRYRQPARLDDLLEATLAVAKQGPASLMFEQTLRRPEAPASVMATALVRVACVDAGTFKPRVWPAGWLEV